MNRIIFILVLLLLCSSSCTKDRLRVTRDGVTIELDIEYLLQQKNFKKISYNAITSEFSIENFGSDTSETLDTFGKLLVGYMTGTNVAPLIITP